MMGASDARSFRWPTSSSSSRMNSSRSVVDVLDDAVDVLRLLPVEPGDVLVDRLVVAFVDDHVCRQGHPERLHDIRIDRAAQDHLEHSVLQARPG